MLSISRYLIGRLSFYFDMVDLSNIHETRATKAE